MTNLADKIEALAQAVKDTYEWGARDGAIFALGATVHNNLPTILRALRERDQAVEALRLFVGLMNDPDYDLGELCEEFCNKTESILASIEENSHE